MTGTEWTIDTEWKYLLIPTCDCCHGVLCETDERRTVAGRKAVIERCVSERHGYEIVAVPEQDRIAAYYEYLDVDRRPEDHRGPE